MAKYDRYDESLRTYLNEIAGYSVLSNEELKELFIKKNAGDKEAYQLIINSNLGLPVYFAEKYRSSGIDFLDLIQEGNLGLIKAIDMYDINVGAAFSTYASYWIKCYIGKAINEKDIVRLPDYLKQLIARFNKTESKLLISLGRKPSNLELCKEMNITLEQLKQIENAKLLLFQSSTDDLTFVESEIVTDEVNSLSQSPETIVVDKIYNEEIRNTLENIPNLSEKERDILIKRSQGKKLDELGEEYGVTKERIRQIQNRAKNKAAGSELAYLVGKKPKVINKYDQKYLPYQLLYQRYSNYSQAIIDEALLRLPKNDIDSLKLRYGEKFDRCIQFTSTSSSKVFYALKKLENILISLAPDTKKRVKRQVKKNF